MSEFGRGYATCLRQFTNHAKRLDEYLEMYRGIRARDPTETFMSDDRAAQLWMNGASDHLYELVRPVKIITRDEWIRAKRIRDQAIDIGHGFHGRGTAGDCRDLLKLADELLQRLQDRGLSVSTLDHCFVTDGVLGLLPDSGTWDCPEDLER